MRTREVVKGLKEDHAATELLAVFSEAPALFCQWSQRMPQGQVEPLNQTGTDLLPQGSQPRCPTTDALTQRVQAATFLLFDQLRIDQLRMGLQHRLAGPSTFACTRKLFDLMVDLNQRRPVATETITEETGHATHDGRRHLYQEQGAWSVRGPT